MTNKYGTGFAALGALFLIGSLMRSPESQAKGAFSSPVTVMNTAANPASITDAERLARTPYQVQGYKATCSGVTQCQFDFPGAPAGQRLVIQNVSGIVQAINGTTAPPTIYF